ncbi:MAG: type IV toxin-antitoxin system AbiEi family antitoxin domain-containing protein [Acidobacteria bacterium]|jgi:predicted transcriptional regulator of viral defense system|nr:type IV toxin-antitoxin system AbiEi family antitoxin domain-containing protein [Acidobacteriota bacterium]
MQGNAEKIQKLLEENNIVRSSDLTKIGVPLIYLSRLVEKGELLKIGHGVYTRTTANFNENQSLLEAINTIPNSVVCLLSALRFHELTTQNPFEIWLAIEAKAWRPKTQILPLRLNYFSGKAFTEGIETRDIEGVTLRVYNPAKTVADCFKYRNKIGLDVALEALRDAWRQKKATMDELWHYAKICRMSNVMHPYLESLV